MFKAFDILSQNDELSNYIAETITLGSFDVKPNLSSYRKTNEIETILQITFTLYYKGEEQKVMQTSNIVQEFLLNKDQNCVSLKRSIDDPSDLTFKKKDGFWYSRFLEISEHEISECANLFIESIKRNYEFILSSDEELIPDQYIGSISSISTIKLLSEILKGVNDIELTKPINLNSYEGFAVSLADANDEFLLFRFTKEASYGSRGQYPKSLYLNILIRKNGSIYTATKNNRTNADVFNHIMDTYRLVNGTYFWGAATNDNGKVDLGLTDIEFYVKHYMHPEGISDWDYSTIHRVATLSSDELRSGVTKAIQCLA